MARSPVRYSDSLAFLLSATGARAAAMFADALAPLGVSPRAFGVLSNLAAREGQTQQQLADALGMHRNNMVGLVDELEQAGWVRRRRSSADRRAFALELTADGRAVVERVNALVPALDRELGAGLTAAQRRTLSQLLGEVAAELDVGPGVHPHLRARPLR